MKIGTLVLLLALSLLSGCAFTVHETELDYGFSGEIPEVTVADQGVKVESVVDERPVSDPRMITHLKNLHGQTTSGGYAAELPISDIVSNGIREALNQAGYRNSDDIVLNAILQDYEYDSVSGYWSAKKVTSKLSISVTISQDNQNIAKNTVIGKATLVKEDMEGKNSKEMIRELFQGALDDSISQIVEIVDIALR